MPNSATHQNIQASFEAGSEKDLLTGSDLATGTLTFGGFGYVKVAIFISSTASTSAAELSWEGWAPCVGGGGHPLVGRWNSDPFASDKVLVSILSAGVGVGGTELILTKDDGSELGSFVAGGLEFGACVINEKFDVKRLHSIALSSSGNRRVGQGTSETDLFILDSDPIYGQKQSAVIKDFDPSDGDMLHFGGKTADSLPLIDELEFKVVQTSRQLMEASEEGLDLVYWQPYGFLYEDKNSESNGFGSDGGVLTVLDGAPNLSLDSFHISA